METMRLAQLVLVLTSGLPGILAAPTCSLVTAPVCPPTPSSSGFWVNPCDIDRHPDGCHTSETEVATYMYFYTNDVLDKLITLKDDFTRQYFNKNFVCMVNEDDLNHFNWLPIFPEVPKRPGALNMTHLQSLRMYESLPMLSNIAKRMAVGLELVTRDMEYNSDCFKTDFSTVQTLYIRMLCQLDTAMQCKNIAFTSNPNRTIVDCPSSSSARNQLNFRILKELVNVVEYVQQFFGHFSQQRKYESNQRCTNTNG